MTVCLEGRCSIQLSYERIRLPTASSLRPVVCSVLRLGLRCSFVRRPDVGLVETITISVSTLAAVDAIEIGSVLLGFSTLAILRVLLLVVSLFDFHIANIINCWGGGT